MRVPVLIRLQKHEPLFESSMRAMTEGVQRVDVARLRDFVPPGLVVDPRYAAIPTGRRDAAAATLESVAPTASETFVVRGTMDADDVGRFAEEVDGTQVFADPQIDVFPTCGSDPPVGDHNLVATKLNVSQLAQKGLDGSGVAVAIMDTGIDLKHLKSKIGTTPAFDPGNSWTPPGSTTKPGQYRGGHGTMCAFDVLIAAPRATLLDFPILGPSAPGGSAMGQHLSVALMGYAPLLAMWGIAFAASGRGKYKALVVNNSWGMYHPSWDFPAGHPGRYSDNPNHPFNVLVSTLARSGADILFAAGNCGADCPSSRCQNHTVDSITGANALNDVLTLAGCDTNDQRVGYSSQGPAIRGMWHEKPNLTAYTHFKGSEVYGTNTPDSGTSTACPVAAGCVAALRTKVSPAATPPASMILTLQTTAQQSGPSGWNKDLGYGIIDPVAAAQSLGV